MTESPKGRSVLSWFAALGWLAVLIGLVGLLVGALWLFQRSLIFFPDSTQPAAADQVLPEGEDVQFSTADATDLAAWYVPAAEAGRETVLVAPGNAGHRGHRSGLGTLMAEAGYGVLLMDYRGYGGNPGSPTEEGVAQDARAARSFLTAEAGVDQEELVYFGESIGAAVVTELAVEHPPAGLILRSPFTSLAEMGQAAYGVPVGWLLRDDFPVETGITGVEAPVAVIYSDSDTVVPAQQSRAVAQASRQAGNKTLEFSVRGADHNDPALGHGNEVLEALGSLPGG